MNIKQEGMIALFVGLIIIFAANPRIINNVYSSNLGRLCLIGIVILLSMKSVTLGLLVALTIIAGSNKFGKFTEGMENMNVPTSVGEENVPTNGKVIVLTKTETNQHSNVNNPTNESQNESHTTGVDKEDIKTAIMSKDSNTIQTSPNITNDDVEAFTSTMLNPSTLSKGFYSASPV